MASTLNIPYYAMHLQECVGPGKDDVYILAHQLVHDMMEEMNYAIWSQKKKLNKDGPRMMDRNFELNFYILIPLVVVWVPPTMVDQMVSLCLA